MDEHFVCNLNHKSMRSIVYYQNKVLYITNFAEIVYHQVEAIHAGVMIYTCGDDMHTSCDDIPSLREPPNSYFVLRTPTFGLDKKIPGTSPRIFLAEQDVRKLNRIPQYYQFAKNSLNNLVDYA